ncbi:EF-hand domain-containing protein [uncultured Roseibium sp.]|uniref:EF-hand domain-containing protein n=1 Tax=uncultured Roseibium sp. TaxID=1936171 RepID=UPI00261284E3|nr:EF-hand domain-containing protein [uncultured Roseibium sp.]
MKPFKKIAIAALAASVAGTALTAGLPAFAQSGVAAGDGGQQIQQAEGKQIAHKGERGKWGRGHGRGGRERAERLFERFDADKDGVITEAEISEVRAQEFAASDADGSGEISLEEFKAQFMERSNDRMVRAFQFLDSDGDGTVTQEEVDVVANRMFNRLDRDGNGTIERVRGQRGQAAENGGERQQRAERGERRGRGGPARMFMTMFDTDGSGSVTREDFDAKRAELFALADTNGSGSFTLEEFGPLWMAVNENRIVNMFQRADADGSLGITQEEAGKRLDNLMKRADRNKDGVITKADFKGGKKGGKGKKHRG